jgi:hypothetical protein
MQLIKLHELCRDAMLRKELPYKLIALQTCLVDLGPAPGVWIGTIMSAVHKDIITASRFSTLSQNLRAFSSIAQHASVRYCYL